MSDTVRVTLDVDRDWISRFVAIDTEGQLTFDTATCSIVSIEGV